MKKIICIVCLMFLSLNSIAIAEYVDAEHDKVIQYLRSDEEPQIIDAVWMTNSTLYVGVYDDGTIRDGYAQYLCLKLHDFNLTPKTKMVKVVDYQKVLQKKGFKQLGICWCSK